MVGVAIRIDPTSAEAQKAAQYAMKEYNKNCNSSYLLNMISIVSAKSQIVAGLKYYLTVQVEETNCLCGSNGTLEHCSPRYGGYGKVLLCDFQVYYIPWLDSVELIASNCQA
ncbi:cystatin-M-like [Callorhinchus milii]|nr:cystatin-M-like [Callorhinchus milii]